MLISSSDSPDSPALIPLKDARRDCIDTNFGVHESRSKRVTKVDEAGFRASIGELAG